MGFHDLLNAIHLDAHGKIRLLTEKEYVFPLKIAEPDQSVSTVAANSYLFYCNKILGFYLLSSSFTCTCKYMRLCGPFYHNSLL